MAAILCKCGNRLSNTNAPNDIQYHVYSDVEWDEISQTDVWHVLEIPRPKNDVWKCPECKRIYIFSEIGEVIAVYKLEE